MPNFASTLKAEISRLAAKEVRKGTPLLKRASARYRREIAAMKREISQVVKRIDFLLKLQPKVAPAAISDKQQIRFSAKWLQRNREKLDLSANEYAKLIGVSPLTIYGWEKGKSKPRAKHLPALAAIRGLGKREARVKLELLA